MVEQWIGDQLGTMGPVLMNDEQEKDKKRKK